MNYLYVAAGGAIGSVLRLLVRQMMLPLSAANGYFLATLSVNIIGSFIIGFLFPVFEKTYGLDSKWWFFLTTGILGGFTTFSAFSLDFMILFGRNQSLAIGYVLASVLFSFVAVFIGANLGKFLV